MYTYIHIYIYTYIHIFTYIHVHTCTYMCMRWTSSVRQVMPPKQYGPSGLFPGELPVCWGISPLERRTSTESNLETCRISARTPAVSTCAARPPSRSPHLPGSLYHSVKSEKPKTLKP